MNQLDDRSKSDQASVELARDQLPTGDSGRTVVVPVIAEELTVGKRTVETARIRVQTAIHEHEEIVDEPLQRNSVDVVIVPVQEFVIGSPPVARQEGNTYIIPVFEERLVVERRLFLKEEVHIRSEQTNFHNPQSVVLRQTEVTVERLDSSES